MLYICKRVERHCEGHVFALRRPVIVIGGSSDRNQETAGAFQEFPQVIIPSHRFFSYSESLL